MEQKFTITCTNKTFTGSQYIETYTIESSFLKATIDLFTNQGYGELKIVSGNKSSNGYFWGLKALYKAIGNNDLYHPNLNSSKEFWLEI